MRLKKVFWYKEIGMRIDTDDRLKKYRKDYIIMAFHDTFKDRKLWYSGIEDEGEFKRWYENGQLWEHSWYKNGDLIADFLENPELKKNYGVK